MHAFLATVQPAQIENPQRITRDEVSRSESLRNEHAAGHAVNGGMFEFRFGLECFPDMLGNPNHDIQRGRIRGGGVIRIYVIGLDHATPPHALGHIAQDFERSTAYTGDHRGWAEFSQGTHRVADPVLKYLSLFVLGNNTHSKRLKIVRKSILFFQAQDHNWNISTH